MDIQVLLLIILSLLTINLVVVGVYIIVVLKDLRRTVNKMDTVLSTVQDVTDKVSLPIMSLSGLAAGVSSGLKMFDAIRSLKKNEEDDEG